MDYVKETIFVDNGKEGGMSLTYYLSNSLDEIKEIIHKTIGGLTDVTDTLDEKWELNHNLSKSVKDLMINHNVNYSMTFHSGIVINRRFSDNWYFYDGISTNGGKKFHSVAELRCKYMKLIQEMRG
jgi:hypothetical protein